MSYNQGLFKPKNPEKYIGDVNNIQYRSGWELTVMQKFDNSPSIIAWNSEELIIPYNDRATGKLRRYFPDFVIKKRGPDGKIEVIVIEVKPYAQSIPPTKTGKKTDRRYLTEVKTFATNASKWESAQRFCAAKGWRFVVITEKDIYGWL
jgi:hypothetical protein